MNHILLTYTVNWILYSGYHSYFVCFFITPTVRTLEVRLNQIKRKKWMVLVFTVLVSLASQFTFPILLFCTYTFFSSFFFPLLFCLSAVKQLQTHHTDLILNTSQALHTVTDSVTDCAHSQSLSTTIRPQTKRASTLHNLPVCAVGTVCREEV